MHRILACLLILPLLSCLTVIPEQPAPQTRPSEYRAHVANSSLRQSLELQGLIDNPESPIRIKAQEFPVQSNGPDYCVVPAFVLFLVPCWREQKSRLEIVVSAPPWPGTREERHSAEIQKKQYIWLPLILAAPFLSDDAAIQHGATRLGPEIASSVKRLQAQVDYFQGELERRRGRDRHAYPIIITGFQSEDHYETDGSHELSATVRIFNNSGKDIKDLRLTMQPVDATDESERRVRFDPIVASLGPVGKNQFAAKRSLSSLTDHPEARALLLTEIRISLEDGEQIVLDQSRIREMMLPVTSEQLH